MHFKLFACGEIDTNKPVLSLVAHISKGWGMKDREEHCKTFRDISTMQSTVYLSRVSGSKYGVVNAIKGVFLET
jgi:hypothetical protein